MSAPSDEELRKAVDAACAGHDDLEKDAKALTRTIADDHFMWRIKVDRVQKILDEREAAKVPPRKVPEELFSYDWGQGQAADIMHPRDWTKEDVEGIHHAQAGLGSFGCFLIKLAKEENGVVVLKQKTQDLPNEILAAGLLRAVGVPCPLTRPLADDELESLIWALREVPVTVHGTCNEIHSPRFRESGAVLMEFIPGHDLDDLPLSQRDPDALSEKDWQIIGAMLVVDVIINNPDRVPTIWRSDGNGGNIIVDERQKPGARVVAIDQTVNQVLNTHMLNQYVTRVSHLMSPEAIAHIEQFFDLPKALGAEKAAVALDAIEEGMKKTITLLLRDSSKIVSAALAEVKSHSFSDFDEPGASAFITSTIAALPTPSTNSKGGVMMSRLEHAAITDGSTTQGAEGEDGGLLGYIRSICSFPTEQPAGKQPSPSSK